MPVDYIVLAHDQPARVERLVARLADGGRFFVHFERDAPDDQWVELRRRLEPFPVTWLPRRHCPWGRIGIVQATVDGLNAYVTEGQGSHAVMVSGSDYPVKSTTHIGTWLGERAGETFGFMTPLPFAAWGTGGFDRIDRWHIGGRVVPPQRLMKEGPRRSPLPPYGGSQWIAWSRPAAAWATGYLASTPKIERFFRRTHTSDELMLQTVLMNSPFADTVRPPVHAIHWDGGSHPTEVSSGMVAGLVAGPHLFARKFADPAVLDLVDATID